MAKISTTLPNRLSAVFSRLYQLDTKDNPWVIWATLLDAEPDSVAFLERLAIIKAACKKLTDEISALEMEKALMHDCSIAIQRLATLTNPMFFSEPTDQWKKRASSQNATSLIAMHYVYLHHSKVTEYETSELADIVAELHGLEEKIKKDGLDDELKDALLLKLRELIYFIERVDKYGLEATWAANSSLAGTLIELDAEIKGQSADLNDKMINAGKRVFKWLTVAGTVHSGLQALSVGGTFLLDSFISSAR